MNAHIAVNDLRRSFREASFGAGTTLVRGTAGDDLLLDFALSAAAGLSSNPRRMESRFLYDAEGSALFDLITEQPEYYLTRCEAQILQSTARTIRDRTGGVALVELGSGSSAKTDHLLRAWLARGRPVRYVPVDVSEQALRGACRRISTHHPEVRVIGVNSDFHHAFSLLRELSPALVLFLGSTIGNLGPREMSGFLGELSAALAPGDFFLLGIDLVKDPVVIEAAYNDAAGVTRQFTRNLFARMNRDLGSTIDLSVVEHEARYNPAKEQVETRALFRERQTIRIRTLGETFSVAKGERILIEISRKFALDQALPYLESFGFAAAQVHTDDRGWFALVLLERVRDTAGGRA